MKWNNERNKDKRWKKWNKERQITNEGIKGINKYLTKEIIKWQMK